MTRRVVVVPEHPNWLAAGVGALVLLCLPIMLIQAFFSANWGLFLVVLFFLVVMTMAIVVVLIHLVGVGSARSVQRRARHRAAAEEQRIADDPRAWSPTEGES